MAVAREFKEKVILNNIPLEEKDRLDVNKLPKELIFDTSPSTLKLVANYDFTKEFPDKVAEKLAIIISSYTEFGNAVGECVTCLQRLSRQNSIKRTRKTRNDKKRASPVKNPVTKIRYWIGQQKYPVEVRATYLRLLAITGKKELAIVKKIGSRKPDNKEFTKQEAMDFLVRIIRTCPESRASEIKLKVEALDRIINIKGWAKDTQIPTQPLILNWSVGQPKVKQAEQIKNITNDIVEDIPKLDIPKY